ncbi:OmpA family protein [Paracoccaceae bacterium Fryx2]|nr:OmpA family protein [Paracoccaceae bacterium Fryx2]
MRLPNTMIAPAAFAGAAVLAGLVSFWAAMAIEQRSTSAVTSVLLGDGITWASVRSDGLQVQLIGTAPNEAARFRAVNLAGSIVDAGRVRDRLEVTPIKGIEAPRFSVEMLRNGEGISLIGLLPRGDHQEALTEGAVALAGGAEIADMLETTDFPAPEGWDAALDFGMEALKMLPRSKISVAADRVAITAISDSDAEKRKLESELARRKPEGLAVEISISAPRPVLTPFTLRFVKDADGARFDACSADTPRARDRILAAATRAGVMGKTACTVGLGVPSPSWAEAAEAAIRAVDALGEGSVTFSDADVTLLASVETPQAVFDTVVGELQTALPPVFSLKATLPPRPVATPQGPAEFTATLKKNGQVQLRGRLTDDLLRAAVDSFARAQFGATQVYTATRLDADLPDGWPVRVLAGLESLAQLAEGTLLVRADTVEVAGVTGSQDARARIAQLLSAKLGQGQTFKVAVTYDERLDPLAALPSPQECVSRLNAVLAANKITFAPGSAEIDGAAGVTLDALTGILGECPELKLEIAGHTDSQGSEEGNRALSQARAEAVLLALQGRRAPVLGLTALGYGETRPLADNGSEAGREANRRIEFTLLESGEAADDADPAAASADAPADAPGAESTDSAPAAGAVPEGRTGPDGAAAVAPDAAAPPAPPAAAENDARAPVTPAGDPDFSGDDSPSVAPAEATLKPRPRPARP